MGAFYVVSATSAITVREYCRAPIERARASFHCFVCVHGPKVKSGNWMSETRLMR